MKVGLIVSTAPRDRLVEIARRAEALGFNSLWAGEHVVLPVEDDEDHPYGRPAVVSPRNETLAPFVELAYLAGAAQRIRVATGVILLPLRNVFVTAREIATLDSLSNGRLDVGIGVGWHEGEFKLMDADFANRGAVTDEFLDALDRLFQDAEPSFEGRHIAFPKVGFEPKPTQTPRPPILVGGDSLPAMRRAARRGDGWYGHASSPEQAKERIATVRRLLAEAGRDNAKFESVVQVWDPPPRDQVEAYAAAGADRLVTCPFRIGNAEEDPIRPMEDYARNLGSLLGA